MAAVGRPDFRAAPLRFFPDRGVKSAKRKRKMRTNLTPGKIAGLTAVSNRRGVVAAVAMDQVGTALASEYDAVLRSN